jgi:hypothetical protein
MPISRRKFFRGLIGQSDDRQRQQQKRTVEVDSYVRTNLLPYDFALTSEQTADVLAAAASGVDIDGDGDLFTYENRMRLREIVDARVQVWREEYLRAEDMRKNATHFVQEFLLEASSEERERLGSHFQMPYPADLDQEIDRQIRVWLSDLSNAFLAQKSATQLRELVFLQIRSWC